MDKPTENVKPHANSLWEKQKEEDFPIQVLRNGMKPSDESRELDIKKPLEYKDCWVDVYEGPNGIGFVVNYEIVKDTDTYVKSENYGQETWRSSDWTLQVKEKLDAKHLD